MRTPAAETLFSYYKLNAEVNSALTKRADAVLPYQMTMAQFELLDYCCGLQEIITPIIVAEKFSLTKGAITNLIKQLRRKSFVELTENPADGRSKYIVISPDGKNAHKQCIIAMSEMTSELFGVISSHELEACMPVLNKLKNWLDNS